MIFETYWLIIFVQEQQLLMKKEQVERLRNNVDYMFIHKKDIITAVGGRKQRTQTV